jgi:hypothetical protein
MICVLRRTAILLSAVAAIVLITLAQRSFSVHYHTCWQSGSVRYDIVTGHGTVMFQRLYQFQARMPARKIAAYPVETESELSSFQQLPWWQGDNSWWQRVGYTVNVRRRFVGCEWASGTFWPPFGWQHPKVRFDLFQIPLWMPVVLFLITPLWWFRGRMRSKSSRTASDRLQQTSQNNPLGNLV